MSHLNRLQLLKESWNIVAQRYRQEFVPRFRPWVNDAIDALIAQSPPPSGIVFVPGVGTGDEICALAQKLPNYDYYGVDLSDTMIEIAKEVCKDINTNVTLAVGDASSTADAVLHPGNINNNNTKNTKVAAVFSCFTLQQLPNPREALANWASLLGGEGTVMVVLFWPTNVEEKGGPWQLVAQLCPPQRMNAGWEDDDVVGGAVDAGCTVVEDRLIQHEMHWPSANVFWDAMTRGGPWHPRRLLHGDAFMEEKRQEFVKEYGGGGGGGGGGDQVLTHRPRARLIVFQKRRVVSSSL